MQTNAISFRPQQGLTIMNYVVGAMKSKKQSFRPQQGLTIMNYDYIDVLEMENEKCFRPQQGLTIMNMDFCDYPSKTVFVSVPNRG